MVHNLTSGAILATKTELAQNPWQRMKGLLGTSDFPKGTALIITHCQSIHMFFMKFPIDVIFCDDQNRVVGLCAEIKPFCLSPVFFKACCDIELPTGTIAASKTQIGDYIRWS